MPCAVRKAISQPMPGLAAQSTDAITKIAMPASSTDLRPLESASRPQSGTLVVAVIR